MPPTQRPRLPIEEGKLVLATNAIRIDPKLSVSRAATLYDTPRSILYRRVAGARLKAIANILKRKLLPIEE
ncbi:hypothetical protein CC78DRAFT_126289 [Lojkania enalia]|uniref:HTH psq-type domain-containing protein n=1 Tax=Lojkania enalia TaxID=147567 RepID=A0A9P4JWL9_9PLEO|nr:hypothetical protein CC78DRAFT_126289 [Didymosphaeria enalia]